jgi:hypothetical protein
MARAGTVCAHLQRDDIDAELVKPVSIATIAALFGNIGPDALRRHKLHHLLPLLTEGQGAEAIRAEALVAQMWTLQMDTLDILEAARDAGDYRNFLIGVKGARGNLELLARLGGFMNAQDAAAPRRVEVVFESPPPPPQPLSQGQVAAPEVPLLEA